ncbi:MAG TPA: capsular biosynthesis protein [Clostridiales bacterium]|nr:capsular biosynthesis protein [Clostridiales bacterium]
MKKEVIAHKDPKSPISEVFRTLRTNIQFMSNSKRMKTLLVTSTFPGEGKSWVTSNLAVTFAQAGKRVILIDADMRKGRQYAIFGVSPRPGLSNLLAEYDIDNNNPEQILDYVQETEVENLFVISAGNVPPNPSELLVSQEMSRVLEELRKMCDIIIIDGTPCELVTDSVILSRMVETTIVVTAHKMTKKDALQRVVKNIKNVGGNLAGVVINKVPVSAKKYGEKYYYYGHDKGEQHKKHNSKIKEEFTQKNDITPQKQLKTEVNNSKDKDLEIPKAMREKEQSSLDTPMTSSAKTNDILNQINQYLEKEKNT